MFGRLKKFLQSNKLTNEIITDFSFRTAAFSLCAFVLGTGYAAFNLAVGIMYGSAWYLALGLYYIMLGVIRGGVLLGRRKSAKLEEGERVRYGMRQSIVCGALFIVMTLFLSVMVTLIAFNGKIFEYSVTVIYMAAGYTFYRIALSVYNFIRSGKSDHSVRTLHCVNLATALVSFLSLQSAALTAFSQNVNQVLMNAITGAIVCALIMIMGAAMIVAAAVKLKKSHKRSLKPPVDLAAHMC